MKIYIVGDHYQYDGGQVVMFVTTEYEKALHYQINKREEIASRRLRGDVQITECTEGVEIEY